MQTFFLRFLKSTIILCTFCTTLKTLNEILNIKYIICEICTLRSTHKIDIWCVAWWREIFNLFFYCWLKSIYYWLNYDIIHLVDKLLINANWYPFGIFRDSISFLFFFYTYYILYIKLSTLCRYYVYVPKNLSLLLLYFLFDWFNEGWWSYILFIWCVRLFIGDKWNCVQ